MTEPVRALGLLATMVGNLLMRRARRSGPAWGALLLLFLVAGQEPPQARARQEALARSAFPDDVARAGRASARTATRGELTPAAARSARPGSAPRRRARSVQRRELPAPRAPDC